ncbi:MAG: hypothetical protein BWY76_03442 [bacterium ADurb.Bin429]|nr:MAG: hypothetical protein BWY76_03442 [bacterium ADurb.Bin429]
MVRLLPRDLAQVQVQAPLHRQSAEELLQQLHLEIAHPHVLHRAGEDQERPPAQIHRHFAERLVHRQQREPVTPDAAPFAERLIQAGAEHQTHVFDRVMIIHMHIPGSLHLQINERVAREEFQHVVEKPDAGLDPAGAVPVEIQRHRDLGFARGPFAGRFACTHAPPPL